MRPQEWAATPEGRAHLTEWADRFGATWGALGELWDYLPDAPPTLRGMTGDAGSRVLVAVRCAEHNTLVAAVVATPAGRTLILTANEDTSPGARRTPGPRFGTWEPTPRDLDALEQPPIYCPRCRQARPVPDLLALARRARATHRQEVRA